MPRALCAFLFSALEKKISRIASNIHLIPHTDSPRISSEQDRKFKISRILRPCAGAADKEPEVFRREDFSFLRSSHNAA